MDTSQITGTTVRRITPGYISQRLPRTNTIAMNQAYIRKIITNPRTPQCNREAAIQFVLDNPDRFTPFAEHSNDPVFNEWARKRNGNADNNFLKTFRSIPRQ